MDGPADHLQRVAQPLDGRLDEDLHARHALVNGGQEQLLLAGEVEVERPLGHAGLVGHRLHVRAGNAPGREDPGRTAEDLLAAAGALLLVDRPATLSFGRLVHLAPVAGLLTN